jgi:hypothetical protein
VAGRVRTVSEVVGKSRPRIDRLRPRFGRVLDYFEASGGSASDEEIAEFFNNKRIRDVRRRILKPLKKTKLIKTINNMRRLVADWRERLEAKRQAGGEIDAAVRQKNRHKEEQRQYREYGPTKPAEETPPLIKPERVAEIIAERAKENSEKRMKEQRRKVDMTAETFVHDKLKSLDRIRLNLLRNIWSDAGGDPRHVLSAVVRLGYRIERSPAYDNQQFVYPPTQKSIA